MKLALWQKLQLCHILWAVCKMHLKDIIVFDIVNILTDDNFDARLDVITDCMFRPLNIWLPFNSIFLCLHQVRLAGGGIMLLTCPFIRLLPDLWTRYFENWWWTDFAAYWQKCEPVLLYIGTGSTWGKGMKHLFWESTVKVTWGRNRSQIFFSDKISQEVSNKF